MIARVMENVGEHLQNMCINHLSETNPLDIN